MVSKVYMRKDENIMKIVNFAKNKYKKLTALLIAVQLLTLLSGCGSTYSEIPELIEPVSAIASYRPVSKRIVASTVYIDGVVVPTEYPSFAREGVDIASIEVGVGDYVEEGSVVATAVGNSDEIDSVSRDIASLNRKRTMTKNISDKTIEKLGYEKKIKEYLQDEQGIRDKTSQIETEKENQRYQLALIDSQISSKNETLTELQSKSEGTVFYAAHSGYVSYVKDVSASNHAEANENVVVISDYDDLYIDTTRALFYAPGE